MFTKFDQFRQANSETQLMTVLKAPFGTMVAFLLAVYIYATSAALAQDYPQKPVSIIVPVAAGVGADVIVRILADRLSERWKQQVVIVNRPGGSGSIAAQAAASANPDGYTLYMAVSSGFVVIPETSSKWPVDLATDFVTIGLISDQPMIIAVTPSLGVNTLSEFIDLARRRPAKSCTVPLPFQYRT